MIFLAKKLGDITTDDILQIALVFMCIGAVAYIVMVVWQRKVNRENDSQPIQGMEATIVDMERLAPNVYKSEVWVMFEGNDGKRIRINCRVNNDFVIGDKGFVKWQGSRLFSFDRGKKAPSAIMRDHI